MKKYFPLLLCVLILLSCHKREKPNLILISIDSLRTDYLAPWGGKAGDAPNINALTQQSVLFENCFTPVPLTLPAHVSLFTSTFPQSNNILADRGYFMSGDLKTFPEVLRQSSFKTLAVTGGEPMTARTGLSRGFSTFLDDFLRRPSSGNPLFTLENADQVDYERSRRPAEEVVSLISNELSTARVPLFLFAHFHDLVQPYPPPNPGECEAYAARLKTVDEAVGKLMDALKAQKLYDTSIIVLLASHGEALGGDEGSGHGYTLQKCVIHVPLIVKPAGGSTAVKRVSEWVSLVDVAPTILHMMEIRDEAFAKQAQGRDLSPLLAGKQGAFEEKPIIGWTHLPRIDGVGEPLSMILSPPNEAVFTSRTILFDLASPPGKAGIVDDPQRVAVLRGKYETIVRGLPIYGSVKSAPQTAHPGRPLVGSERLYPDPAAWAFSWAGAGDRAIASLEKRIKEGDAAVPDLLYLATLYRRQGDMGKMRETLQKASTINPANYDLLLSLLEMDRMTGNYPGMETTIKRISALYGSLPEIAYNEILLKLVREDYKTADTLINNAVKRFGPLPMVLLVRGNVILRKARGPEEAGKAIAKIADGLTESWLKAYFEGMVKDFKRNREGALASYMKSVKLGSPFYRTYLRAGVLSKELDNLDDAARLIRVSLLLSPGDPESLYEWGDLMAKMGRLEPAREAFEGVLRINPGNESCRVSLMKVLWLLGEHERALRSFRAMAEKSSKLLQTLARTDPIVQQVYMAYSQRRENR